MVAERGTGSFTINDMGLLNMWEGLGRKYVIKKYFGKISPRLFTGKEAQDSVRQGNGGCLLGLWKKDKVHRVNPSGEERGGGVSTITRLGALKDPAKAEINRGRGLHERDQTAGGREGSNLTYAHKLCFEYLDTA